MTGVTPHGEGVAPVATPTDDNPNLLTVIARLTVVITRLERIK